MDLIKVIGGIRNTNWLDILVEGAKSSTLIIWGTKVFIASEFKTRESNFKWLFTNAYCQSEDTLKEMVKLR